MELRVQVDDEFMGRLSERLGYKNATDVARDALTLLDWASQESAEGRFIYSGRQGGRDLARLALPKLDEIRSRSGRLDRPESAIA
jgi:hypothetical protein